jgi:hypothetical protein
MRAQIEGMPVHADAFAVMFGSDEFTERMKRRQAQLASPLAPTFLRNALRITTFVARTRKLPRSFACSHFLRGSRTVKTVSRTSDRASAVPP